MPPFQAQVLDLSKRTNSVNVNPPDPATSHLSNNGSSWLWAAFALQALIFLAIGVWTFFVPRGKRVFHHTALIILVVQLISYFGQASDLGFTAVATEFSHHSKAGSLRQIWWARYVAEIITWPLLVLTLTLATALPLSEIIQASFWSGLIFVNLLLGALVRSTYKWGFFVFAVGSVILTFWFFFGAILPGARALGSDYSGLQISNTVWLAIMLLLYLIAWGVCEGGNVVSVTSEFIWYGVLDILSKPFFLIAYLGLLTRLNLTKLHLQSAKYTNTASDNLVLTLANTDTNGAPRASHDTVVQEKPRSKFSLSRKGHYDATPNNAGRHVTTETTTTAPAGTYGQAPTGTYTQTQAPAGNYTQAPAGSYTQAPAGTYAPPPPSSYHPGHVGDNVHPAEPRVSGVTATTITESTTVQPTAGQQV